MKLRIVNQSGDGVDTKVYVIDGDEEKDITKCFYNTKISIPAEGTVKAELWAHAVELDVTFFKMKINRDIKDR